MRLMGGKATCTSFTNERNGLEQICNVVWVYVHRIVAKRVNWLTAIHGSRISYDLSLETQSGWYPAPFVSVWLMVGCGRGGNAGKGLYQESERNSSSSSGVGK